MAREKLIAVRELLREKRFDEARALLATIEHPKTHEWQVWLNEISPPKSSLGQHAAPNGDPQAERETTVSVNIVCPRCEQQTRQTINLLSDGTWCQCPRCDTSFRSRVERVRSQRSWQDKEDNRRCFSIRTIHPVTQQEDLIEFDTSLDARVLELKPKAMAVFSYLDGSPAVVQNLTIDRHILLEQPRLDGAGKDTSAGSWWLWFTGFVFVIVFVLWLLLQLNR